MNMPGPIKDVDVTDMGFSGDGIAREADVLVFIPYALPGDRVRVQVTETKDQQSWARVMDVITPSPTRVTRPPCAHCFDCGGCTLQHWASDAYQSWKQEMVVTRLNRAGMIPRVVNPMRVIGPGTRRRATFCARLVQGRVNMGFNRHHSDHIVNLDECHVVTPGIISILPDLRLLMSILLGGVVREVDVSVSELDTGFDILITGDIKLDLIRHEAIAEFVRIVNVARLSMRVKDRAEIEVLVQPKPTRMTVGGVVIDPAPGCFLQPSRAGEQALIDCVVFGVAPEPGMRVIDLFAGMGTFTYPVALAGASVHAVDVDVYRGSVAWPMGQGARAPGVVTTEPLNLYKMPVRAVNLSAYDAIIFDPPRAGAKGQAVEIAESGVRTIVAVSCNPATFITDCVPFRAAGYEFVSLTVVDQFTWTAHVELVGVFQKLNQN